ncbi:cell division protein FtsK [Streptomyces benahoarensis]|uniref:Cell division protein FtsK n=2 Tax=Streptomyces benahoarensis TaxID=2595054 RepID=A0A553ZND3_9ACTN|nr:cell division protein FtsK [Streptomyces benahoarensis]TSB42905.1 cell division protein FtsK [Streptomyces benahoarensis]
MGTVHDLADHRAARATSGAVPTVSLTKDTARPTDEPTGPHSEPSGEDATAEPKPPVWARSYRIARNVVTHDRSRKAARLAARHGSYVTGGAVVLARRAWDGRTTAVHQRMIASAAAAGQAESVADWQDKADRFRQARHARRMALITGVPAMAKGALIGAGVLEGSLLAIGTAMALSDDGQLSDVIAPTQGLIEFIHTVCVIVSVVWGPLVAAAPWVALLALWAVGRSRDTAPAWAKPTKGGEQRDVVPDEGAILDALRHLGVGPLNQAFKQGWQPRWVSGTGRLGNGWHTQLQLPMGVTVEMVNDKKKVLAHNLLRLPVEVWPTEPSDKPGVLDLWVADQGSLSGKVPPWPLLEGGEADYFKGVPVGVSQRGEPVVGKLMAANYMVGGIMGSGKSSLVISLLLGAMLDPLVEIEAYVMAYNVDYDPMKPRLRNLVKGDEDEQIEAALKALRGLRDEVTLRGKLLEELGGENSKLTRELAARDARMRPKVVVFDECHELFMHKKYGAEAEELAIKVMKKARKVGITLIWVTVSPTADSIPKDVTRNTSHRVAFAVGDHVANDGLLGTGKHKAGITATTLNPAENIGTALTVGFTKNAFELIRSYYVRKDSKTDEVTPVVNRALDLCEGVTPVTSAPAGEPVDHLRDVANVLLESGPDGPARMRSDEVRQRLAVLNPDEYRGWTAADLVQALKPHGVEPYKSGGLMVISRERVLEALGDRDVTDATA